MKHIFSIPTSILSEEYIQKAIHNHLSDQKCVDLHPGFSCNLKMINTFSNTCKSLYKTYLLVHLIPFLIFKRKKVINKPIKQLKNLIKGFLKSMLFVGLYMAIVRRTVCFVTQNYKFTGNSGALGGFLGGIALIFQPQSRQSQIALFCINKTLQTFYHLARRRNYPVRILYGECLLIGIAAAIISYYYVDCNKAFPSKYLKVLDRLIGSI